MSNREFLPSRARWQVLVDFDGTVAPDDPTDRLFERFADPLWRVVETAWQSGEISSRECMQRQVALLRATPEELDQQIRGVRIDPGFPPFLEFCRRGADVKIVSDGLDRVVGAALRTRSSRCRSSPTGSNGKAATAGAWRSRTRGAIAAWAAPTANARTGERLPGPRVVIGDGRSDFCMSARADYRHRQGRARRATAAARGRPHATFADFDEVTAHLAAWLASSEPRARPRCRGVHLRRRQLPSWQPERRLDDGEEQRMRAADQSIRFPGGRVGLPAHPWPRRHADRDALRRAGPRPRRTHRARAAARRPLRQRRRPQGHRLARLVRERGGGAPPAARALRHGRRRAACRWGRSWRSTTPPSIRATCLPLRSTRRPCGSMAGASPGTATLFKLVTQKWCADLFRSPSGIPGASRICGCGHWSSRPSAAATARAPASPHCPAA